MELAPTLGWRLKVPVITSCVYFDWDGVTARFKRPILGGKLLASFSANLAKGAVISVQRGAWKDEVVPEESSVPVPVKRFSWQQSWEARKTEVLDVSEEVEEGEEDITKAEILISTGRGIGDPDNLPIIKELADKLGGMISCSRPVVDMQWLPASRQVGISGKTVSPVIYLALGISGQTNHVVGMDASGTIIAVNKDPMAPVFNVAHYGVVDDILEFIPELLEQLKKK
jgi:electron transfer flavoprotein alpha subunit